MEVTVEHLGAMQFAIKAGQHSIVSDQPTENGGFDEGMTPLELFLASLGACAGFYAAQFLQKRKLATEGTHVRVTAEKLLAPGRLKNFRRGGGGPFGIKDEHGKGGELAVRHCFINQPP